MCINGHHNRLGDSEASAGMAWMSPKRRGRAQRRVSGKTQLVRGQLNFGLCPAPRRNCHRKNCCSGTPDHPRGQPDNFCGGAHHVGCVKGRSLRTTLGSLRRDSSRGAAATQRRRRVSRSDNNASPAPPPTARRTGNFAPAGRRPRRPESPSACTVHQDADVARGRRADARGQRQSHEP